jgi:hypothetical protein
MRKSSIDERIRKLQAQKDKITKRAELKKQIQTAKDALKKLR